MSYTDSRLWKILNEKAEVEDRKHPEPNGIRSRYVAAVQEICDYGVDRAKEINLTFPMYTLHDETHICNVLGLMANLLGKAIERLTRDEAAMLLIAACCHDIGMSCNPAEKKELLDDSDKIEAYLEAHHDEYVKAYSDSKDGKPNITDDIFRNYLRSIHHERVEAMLQKIKWPSVLGGKVDRKDAIKVCQSHGTDAEKLRDRAMDSSSTVDFRLCGVLLRLADILDFDASRAPKTLYRYFDLDSASDPEAKISRDEWKKHYASDGFVFPPEPSDVPYSLDYSATCYSMQIEQAIVSYLDWVDQELGECSNLLRRFTGRWQDLVLPLNINREGKITADGYVSGQYHLSLDNEKVLRLLVGNNLYSDPTVFVRELIQNAIDAVRTRKQIDRSLPPDWTGQINIRCWTDEQGYHWFRIEDNGIGMSEDTLLNYFLKIGSSYYTSNDFEVLKRKNRADPDYTPISRFGIGILSCFMGDEKNAQVYVSTKHIREDGKRHSALRLQMNGLKGYYYLARKGAGHNDDKKHPYLKDAGTAIAVRTGVAAVSRFSGFKDVVDRYVACPSVPIHYEDEKHSSDYMTEQEFMKGVRTFGKNGLLELPLPDETLEDIKRKFPGLQFKTPPKVILKCFALDGFSKNTKYLCGAVLAVKVEWTPEPITVPYNGESFSVSCSCELNNSPVSDELTLHVSLDWPREIGGEMQHLNEKYNYIRGEIDKIGWKVPFILDKSRGIPSILDISDNIPEAKAIIEQEFGSVQRLESFMNLKELTGHWVKTIFRLSDLSWYQKTFQPLLEHSKEGTLTSHNGIACGNADFFVQNEYGRGVGTILLLKDRYRPSLGLARDGVERLPLEAAAELAIIREEIKAQGFSVDAKYGSEFFESIDYVLPLGEYGKLFQRRPDFEKRIHALRAPKGAAENDFDPAAYAGKELDYSDFPSVDKYHREDYLFRCLYLAFLKAHFTLCYDRSERALYIKSPAPSCPGAAFFPPQMFVSVENGDPKIFMYHVYQDFFRNINIYNEAHPLSGFLLSNAKTLSENYPGIFRDLVWTMLSEEYPKELMQKINQILMQLRSLPQNQDFRIRDDLLLTEQDYSISGIL